MEASAGLGALGFWLFLAAVIVAGIWFDARKRESQQETLRRIVESGQQLDPEVLGKMITASDGRENVGPDLKISGLITMFVAPGLAILGWFLSGFEEKIFGLMLGVSLMVGLIGVGLFVAGKVYERWYREDQG